MTTGIQIMNEIGDVWLDMSNYTFRFVDEYPYTESATVDVVISVPGIHPSTHFPVCTGWGFPIVEVDQVRIKPNFTTSGGAKVTIFRI